MKDLELCSEFVNRIFIATRLQTNWTSQISKDDDNANTFF